MGEKPLVQRYLAVRCADGRLREVRRHRYHGRRRVTDKKRELISALARNQPTLKYYLAVIV